MDYGQALRKQWREMRAKLAAFWARRPAMRPRASEPNPNRPHQDVRWGLIARLSLIVMLVLVVVFPVTAWLYSHIDDNPDFAAPTGTVRAGQSQAVANAIALIDLEVNQRDWAANDPWFWPTTLLDNMPNYQKGIIAAMGRFAFELTDQVGRARGSSEADPDLQNAAGLLQYPPTVWVWDPSVSFWPTATSESQYRKAMKTLIHYNERLANGQAVFDTRADNLKFTLDRMAADIGSSSSVIDQHIRKTSGFPFQNDTDDIFYSVKGQMYGYYIVLKGLEIDFAGVIKQRDLGVPWKNMMASFRSAIALEPGVVLNGAPDSDFIPCNLCGEGFYLLRARTQLREITNILQQ